MKKITTLLIPAFILGLALSTGCVGSKDTEVPDTVSGEVKKGEDPTPDSVELPPAPKK